MMLKSLPDGKLTGKIRDLIQNSDIGIITDAFTKISLPFAARNAEWDEAGSLCFSNVSTSAHSTVSSKKVKMFYCNPNTSDYVSIYGDAEFEVDSKKDETVWESIIGFFSPGNDQQPVMKIRKVKPTQAYLWDKESNKLVSLFSNRQADALPALISNRLCGEVIL